MTLKKFVIHLATQTQLLLHPFAVEFNKFTITYKQPLLDIFKAQTQQI